MGKGSSRSEPQQSKLSFATRAAPKKTEEEPEVKAEDASPSSSKENTVPDQGTFSSRAPSQLPNNMLIDAL